MSKPIDIADQFEVVPESRGEVTLLHVYEDDNGIFTFIFLDAVGRNPTYQVSWHKDIGRSKCFRRKSDWIDRYMIDTETYKALLAALPNRHTGVWLVKHNPKTREIKGLPE